MSVENLLTRLEDVDGDSFSCENLDYLGFGESEVVHSEGDTEGGGEYTEAVRYFPQLDTSPITEPTGIMIIRL